MQVYLKQINGDVIWQLEKDQSKIHTPDKRFIIDLGIEYGTLTTFYSQRHPERGNVLKRNYNIAKLCEKEASITTESYIKGYIQDEAEIFIKDNLSLNGSTFTRITAFKSLRDSLIMDLVVRYVLFNEIIKSIEISGNNLMHASKNIYYQYPVNNACIYLDEGLKVEISSTKKIKERFGSYLYFRDEGCWDYKEKYWVFHSRILVNQPEETVIKGCHKFYNRPFPGFIDKMFKRLPLYMYFHRIRENKCTWFPFQVNGAAWLKKGDELEITDTWRILSEN